MNRPAITLLSAAVLAAAAVALATSCGKPAAAAAAAAAPATVPGASAPAAAGTAAADGVTAGAPAGVPAVTPVIEIKEKMFIAQTNDVYLNPDDYLGKTIRLEGLFKREEYGGADYCFVIRYGPGCCGSDGNAGFEVAWNKAARAANPWPAAGEWVEASGVLKTYDEGGNPYLYLDLVRLAVLEKRGAEFVTQ
ncbi:MAG: hypothetical protein LBG74_07440 [Spirochaetaceae bacterium]|jgi:hypothetical protein|nr:hypothetical protein [Spirochaetaceae bacterium]